jgi:hypothetical protein
MGTARAPVTDDQRRRVCEGVLAGGERCRGDGGMFRILFALTEVSDSEINRLIAMKVSVKVSVKVNVI